MGQKMPLKTFFFIWIGQFVSIVGSTLTGFALGIYVFQQNGRATDFVLITVFSLIPSIILAPMAGSFVDRYDRRYVMMLSDSVSGVSTVVILAVLVWGELAIWHIYLLTALNAAANAFQIPAYSAITAQLIPDQHLPRANGLVELAHSLSIVAAPVIGGFLLVSFGLMPVILIDLLSFLFAVLTLLFVRFPPIPVTEDDPVATRNIRRDFRISWEFIRERPSLLALLVFNAVINLVAVSEGLITPLVLSFSTEASLGIVLGMGGLGLTLGSVFMSIWGGPRRLIVGAIAFEFITGISTIIMGMQASVVWVAVTVFTLHFAYPILQASNTTLWQRKVPQALHGRVLSTRRMLMRLLLPINLLAAGSIVDRFLEPAMRADGALAKSAGQLIGVGPGRGIGLMMLVTGSVVVLTTLLALLYRPLRQIEEILPDQSRA